MGLAFPLEDSKLKSEEPTKALDCLCCGVLRESVCVQNNALEGMSGGGMGRVEDVQREGVFND